MMIEQIHILKSIMQREKQTNRISSMGWSAYVFILIFSVFDLHISHWVQSERTAKIMTAMYCKMHNIINIVRYATL